MSGTGQEKYIIIIGAMKSGTTTLFKLLSEHPQIAFAKPKEPGFFAFDAVHDKGFDWYHGLFNFDPAQHVYRLEASTDYSKMPFVDGVWERMKARPNAQFKLLYIVRNPLRRLESHARHTQRAQLEIGREPTARSDHSFDNGISAAALAISCYAQQLDAYREAFAAGDLKVVTLDDLKETPQGVMADVFDFLDLKPTDIPETTPRFNKANTHTKVDDSWLRLTSIPVASQIAKTILPQHLRDRLKARFTHKIKVTGRFKMTAHEEQAYGKLFIHDLDRLENVYGVSKAAQWHMPTE